MASSTTSDGAAKVYACPVCSREFNKKANLKVHSRKHTGEKPYACSRPGCNRRFMWKSSVSFHEQNCTPSRRDAESDVQSVPKRHKVIHNGGTGMRNDGRVPTTPISPAESPPRTHVTNIQNPAIIPIPSPSLPNPGLPTSVDFHQGSAEVARHASQISSSRAQHSAFQHHLARQAVGQSHVQHLSGNMLQFGQFSMPGIPESTNADAAARNTALMRNMPLGGLQHMPQYQGNQTSPSSHQLTHKPFNSQGQHIALNGTYPGQSGHPTESQPLPAPSTILEKHMPTAGRPPVIPASMPKPFYAAKQSLGSLESAANGQKNVFDNKLPGSMSSAAKPPVMHGPKMFKMPISMELDDSDDEGAERIIGAQDHFMRTGNIFAGFAPPTRCSPLPASSPIVCPGLSPMPLSPLAPFSPLPPDSPAHNAPNPVHPPLNQSQRSSNSNY